MEVAEEHKEHQHHAVKVSVIYVNTGRKVEFEINTKDTFNELLNTAYKKLGEPRKDTDQYFCVNGMSLQNSLSQTVGEIIKTECKQAVFEIRGNTGGARSSFYF